MYTLTQKEFQNLVIEENYEIHKESDLTKTLVDLTKGGVETKEEFDLFKAEIKQMLPITVISDNELSRTVYYIKKENNTQLEKAMSIMDIVKGKAAQVGEIRTWSGKKYQKTNDGWKPVKNQGGKTEDVGEKREGESIKEDDNIFQRGDEVVVGKYKMSVIGYTDDGRLRVMNKQNEKFTLSESQTKKAEEQAYPKE